MIFEAEQRFSLPYPGSAQSALEFLRDPLRSLARLEFLRGLTLQADVLRAELLVSVPMLGEVSLPFESRLHRTESGASLEALPQQGKLWAELWGEGTLQGVEFQLLDYALHLRAHLDVPQAERWGGAAFEKMLQATARRTLERVSRELPAGIEQAIQAG